MPNITWSNSRCKNIKKSGTFNRVDFRIKLTLEKTSNALVFLGSFQKRSFAFALSRLNPDRCILHSAYMDARLPLTVFFYIIFLFFISIFDAPHFPWNLIRCKAFAVFPVNRGWYLVLVLSAFLLFLLFPLPRTRGRLLSARLPHFHLSDSPLDVLRLFWGSFLLFNTS